MFCTNCGKSMSDDSLFCPHCGAKVAEAPEAQNNQNSYGASGAPNGYGPQGYHTYSNGNTYVYAGAAALKPKKRLGKGGIIGICAGGSAALIAIIIICVVLFTGQPGYEKPVEAMFDVQNTGDAVSFVENYTPLKLIFAQNPTNEYFNGYSYEDILDMFRQNQGMESEFKELFGSDYKASYKIYSAIPLSSSELNELNMDYVEAFGTNYDFIDEAKSLNVEGIMEGSLDSEVKNMTLIVIKIDGKWYIDMFSLE